jgi:hypothetical protein
MRGTVHNKHPCFIFKFKPRYFIVDFKAKTKWKPRYEIAMENERVKRNLMSLSPFLQIDNLLYIMSNLSPKCSIFYSIF